MARLSLLAAWLILPVAAQGDEPAPIATLVDRLAEPESRVGARRELLAIGGRALPELLAILGPAAENDAVDAHALACLDVLTALGEEAASVAPQLLVWIGTVHERDATEPGQETTYPPTLTSPVPPAATGAGDVLFVVLARYPRKLAGRRRLDRM